VTYAAPATQVVYEQPQQVTYAAPPATQVVYEQQPQQEFYEQQQVTYAAPSVTMVYEQPQVTYAAPQSAQVVYEQHPVPVPTTISYPAAQPQYQFVAQPAQYTVGTGAVYAGQSSQFQHVTTMPSAQYQQVHSFLPAAEVSYAQTKPAEISASSTMMVQTMPGSEVVTSTTGPSYETVTSVKGKRSKKLSSKKKTKGCC